MTAKNFGTIIFKILVSIIAIYASIYFGFIAMLMLSAAGYHPVLSFIAMLILPALLFPIIWIPKRKLVVIIWLLAVLLYAIALAINFGITKYNESITINTSPNINISEYLPFDKDSKIVKFRSEKLNFTDNPPKIDGAAALFPVYSAFVNATYPENTDISSDGVFQYNNTSIGYELLAQKDTDIFIGVYPSKEQIEYANYHNTTFEYTPIGTEAFVFFVHKDNPIENLTSDQVRDIYSGKITNWKELGGKNEEIAAFQRNEGSGSQSMLERFMGDTPIMEAPKDLVNDLMVGIIERVSNYKSKSNSIGFSFRYYVEGIIKNPDIKMLSIDGVSPTAENIRNGTYPVVTPIYAVSYAERKNENVDKLLNWILSDEGQRIINETGYVGILGDYND